VIWSYLAGCETLTNHDNGPAVVSPRALKKKIVDHPDRMLPGAPAFRQPLDARKPAGFRQSTKGIIQIKDHFLALHWSTVTNLPGLFNHPVSPGHCLETQS
jgi:hypothetical protein